MACEQGDFNSSPCQAAEMCDLKETEVARKQALESKINRGVRGRLAARRALVLLMLPSERFVEVVSKG